MATISRTGISGGGTIQPAHITNIIDALDGTSATTTIVATGSFSGSLTGNATTASFATTALSASYAANVPTTASYALSALSSSYAVTASFALNAGGGGGGIFALTGSKYATTNNLEITGSLRVTAGVTASLQGTASFAVSASRAVTASFADLSRSVLVQRTAADADYFMVIVDSGNATPTAESLNTVTNIRVNPGLDTISAVTVTGSFNVTGSLTAKTSANINFSDIGSQGNFSIPLGAPGAPNTGSMYWDDAAQRLYIYGNQGWVGANFGP